MSQLRPRPTEAPVAESARVLSIPVRGAAKGGDRREAAQARPARSAGPRTAFQLTPHVSREVLHEIGALIGATPAEGLYRALERFASDVAKDTLEGRAARMFALLLGDLCRQGWQLDTRGREIWATPPRPLGEEGEPQEEVKSRLRAALLAFRSDQLSDPAVRTFLRRMETPRNYRGQRVSVLDLVDEGPSLASELMSKLRESDTTLIQGLYRALGACSRAP